MSSIITFLLFSYQLFLNLINTNYRVILSSYEQSFSNLWDFYILSQGWLIWTLAILGFLVGIYSKAVSRPLAFFIAIFGSFSIVQWFLFSKQISCHYSYPSNLFIVLGIAYLAATAIIKLSVKKASFILGVITFLLFLNGVFGLTTLGNFKNVIRPAFAATESPAFRNDRQKIIELINYLRELTPQKEAIYIGASSIIINPGIVVEGEQQIYRERKLNILYSSEIDSRDFYPINELLKADYIVIGFPFQHHLSPQEQETVKFIFDSFSQPSEFSQDFDKLSKEFLLDNGVTVNIYKRMRPSSLKTTLVTLEEMKKGIQPKPARSYNWVAISPNFSQIINNNPQENADFQGLISENPIEFLYFGETSEKVTVQGIIDSQNCFNVSSIFLEVSSLDGRGKIIRTNKIAYPDLKKFQFSLLLINQGSPYLILKISERKKVKDSGLCQIYLQDVKVVTD